MLDHPAGSGSGVVDHDIDASKRLGALLDKTFGVRVLAQIGGNRRDLSARLLGDFIRRGFERLFAARADGYVHAFPGESARNALADAFAAAGYQRGLALELEVHRFLRIFYCGLCASQRPASAAANRSASTALNAAGSSVGMLWPERGITRRPAVGTVRLRNRLPSMHGSSSSPTMTSNGGENFLNSDSISQNVGRLS